MKNKAIIGISMGDPAGIGPEIIVKFLKKYYKKINADIKIYGSPAVLHKAAANFAESVSFKIIETGNLSCRDFIPGKLSAKCGVEALNAVEKMTQDAINGRIDALVTAPVNKAAINLAGIPFTGHTEFIADMCGTTDFAMMQSSGTLRIAFVTTHIPLAKVPSSISLENIIHTAKLLYDAVKADGISSPLIVLAGITTCRRRRFYGKRG